MVEAAYHPQDTPALDVVPAAAPPPKPVITLTDAAADHLAEMVRQQPDAQGVRIRLRTRGCAGYSYVMEYVQDPLDTDVPVPLDRPLALFIHRHAVMFVIGTEMDFHHTPTQSGFVFRNPNEKGQCGCGTSFHV